MSAEIINESVFWLYCFSTGVAITIVYDVLRILRNVLKHPNVLIALEDIFFWAFVSVVLFLLLYHLNNGTVRWFAVFGLFAGMVFYKKIFGDLLVNFMSTIMNRTLHLVVRILSVPLKLVKSAFYQLYQRFCHCVRGVKKKLTGDIKEVRIVLCKRKNKDKRDTHETDKAS